MNKGKMTPHKTPYMGLEATSKFAGTIAQKIKEMEEKTEAFKESFQAKLSTRLGGQRDETRDESVALSDTFQAVHSKRKSTKNEFENFKISRFQRIESHVAKVTEARRYMLHKIKILEKRNGQKDISKIIIDNTISAVRMQHENEVAIEINKSKTVPVRSPKKKSVIRYKLYPMRIRITPNQ